ncbi:alpha/beta hydrolase [Halomonas dongshanensis]|uniref:Alpha/beta hydrolase n=1 Tax=Halomonas dongshanensis TaxID=2890835 RepID=A0ABT2EEX9_9GAMM|nr:alpha/beta hydrolase [Halomonas dongshanensis]MCS2610139.1 alpha/beta hydrolase [Halomonas dongshanensis]
MPSEKDLAYSPSHFAHAFEATLDRQASAGQALVRQCQPAFHQAGSDPATGFHLFVPEGAGPWPLMVFIHGGYWQQLDHTATDFLAQRYLAKGMAFASLGYGLAPNTSIKTMVAQCVAGLSAATEALDARGGAERILLGGHSAGAQLAFWTAIESAPRIRAKLHELLLVSGVYDLTPLVDTYVNDALGLSLAQARELSPLYGPLAAVPPSRVVIAENDPPTFHQQADHLVKALAQAYVPVERLFIPERDHFDVLEYL